MAQAIAALGHQKGWSVQAQNVEAVHHQTQTTISLSKQERLEDQ